MIATTPFENDHNVYILGAGASVDAGLPLLRSFLNRMRDAYDWLVSRNRGLEQAAIERVLAYRLEAAGATYRVPLDVENIEELFSLASAGRDEVAKDVSLAIGATLDFCRTVASCPTVSLDFNVGLAKAPLGWGSPERESPTTAADGTRWAQFKRPLWEICGGIIGGSFAAAAPGRRNTVVSFNYDMVMEDAFRTFGLSYDYGFGKQSVNYDHDPRGPNGVKLLKLHGSLNWAYREGAGRSFTVYPDYAAVLKLGLVPELVPPTWRKVFDGPLNYVWHEAVTAIRDATRIIVIGFSMPPTDLHFKYLLAAGLQSNISLRRIEFVNPMAKQLRPALQLTLRPELFDGGVVVTHDLKAHEYLLATDRLREIRRELDAHLSVDMTGLAAVARYLL